MMVNFLDLVKSVTYVGSFGKQKIYVNEFQRSYKHHSSFVAIN